MGIRYKVLINGRFSEGWKQGDIIELDENSAKGPLSDGSIKCLEREEKKDDTFDITVKQSEKSTVPYEYDPIKSVYFCGICIKNHRIKTAIGQQHLNIVNRRS